MSKKTVVIYSSSEVTLPFEFDLYLGYPPTSEISIMCHLWTSNFALLDSCKGSEKFLFKTTINQLDLETKLSVLVFHGEDLIGIAIVSLFDEYGVLRHGLFAAHLSKNFVCSDNPEPLKSRCFLDSNMEEIEHFLRAGIFSEVETDDAIAQFNADPKQFDLLKNRSCVLLKFKTRSSTILYSDSFKTTSQTFHRTTSSHLSPVLGPTKLPPRTLSLSGADNGQERVLTNWMVVNGPIDFSNTAPATTSGTGYIASDFLPVVASPIQIIDYELFKDHPAATKAAKLSRPAAATSSKSSMRPTAEDISRLNEIFSQPVRALTQTEKELILKYLWSLTDKKQALLKVLIALSTEDEESAKQTVGQILKIWQPVDIDGALSLLGEEIGVSAFSSAVRHYAVERLNAIASNDEILLYLFQLIQSLRYENGTLFVTNFLIDRAVKDEALATAFFWYLQCEASEHKHLGQVFWTELPKTEMGRRIREGLERQCEFRQRLLDISQVLKSAKDTTAGKTQLLREALKSNANISNSIIGKINLTNNFSFPLPGAHSVRIPIPPDPKFALVRVDDANSFCIKSAKAPFVLACEIVDDKGRSSSARYMFKTGDDLRQDVLVIQLIRLIDGLLKSYGLDLKLSPYRVLATSVDDGFVEFVADSMTLSSILAQHNNDLLAYFRSVRSNPEAPFGIDPIVLDTFSRSCAGYCAITYILGIGDRHMDNLLLTSEGKLFHVDFGYILGRDPKPFPPPMKLCREMVEGMGGANSPYYRSFVSRCTQAFLIMRRHANLIVSLLYLAADADIKDLREQDPKMAILKVQKRLMPQVSDEIAEHHMITLINESTSALFPVVIERLHKWAQYWRT